MSKKIIIVGASGHGKVIADIAKKNGYNQIVFLDDNENLTECDGYEVIGKSEDAIYYKEYDFIVGIGDARIREKIQNMLEKLNLHIVSIVHPNAVIAENVIMGVGSVAMAGAVINTGTCVGKGVIINTCSSVDHDCNIGDFTHISVGAHIAGTVLVGKRTLIGIGAVVCNNISICNECTIGAGAVVINNIEKCGAYVGVPARRIK